MPSQPPDLFDHRRAKLIARDAPLADRMRPRTLDEFVGQDHIVGRGRLLRRAIEADRLSSVIFCGPPGTGKTTLARVIANSTSAEFTTLNAVLSGVKDIRDAVTAAKDRLGQHGRRTLLFVDEVHRFNKAQQDALLPWVENGTVTLIGATTENPYFEVNKALVSRSRIFQLTSLAPADLERVAHQALTDPERGYGDLDVDLRPDALSHLVNVANGDARALLNALELAVETTVPAAAGRIVIDLPVAEESIQQRAVLYDKEGDVHYDTISAFIKSVRGSDPDAALYWLARMVYAGEDPRFILRRLLILASEDVGLADPLALRVVTGCADAFDYVGLPEGQFHLAQATLYLALAPKSNSAMAYFDALDAVQKEPSGDVPSHLRDANRDGADLGHGAGYRYPHAYQEHWVAQQYLPDRLQGRAFYRPSDQGFEADLAERTARRREAQLAAATESPPEVLTFTGPRAADGRDRWLRRTLGDAAERLADLRDLIFETARPPRHAIVLDVGGGTGLLTWEALRRCPEGGVWTLVSDAEAAQAVSALAENRNPLDRPTVIVGTVADLPDLVGDTRFDFVVATPMTFAGHQSPSTDTLTALLAVLKPEGQLLAARAMPQLGPFPSDFLQDHDWAPAESVQRLRPLEARAQGLEAESDGAAASLISEDAAAAGRAAGLIDVTVRLETLPGHLRLDRDLYTRWLGEGSEYRRLLAGLGAEDEGRVVTAFSKAVGSTAAWPLNIVLMTGRRAG